jgi:hypothetical protein
MDMSMDSYHAQFNEPPLIERNAEREDDNREKLNYLMNVKGMMRREAIEVMRAIERYGNHWELLKDD